MAQLHFLHKHTLEQRQLVTHKHTNWLAQVGEKKKGLDFHANKQLEISNFNRACSGAAAHTHTHAHTYTLYNCAHKEPGCPDANVTNKPCLCDAHTQQA